jgi:nitrate/nitrite-specific signal transduction histidine kinase
LFLIGREAMANAFRRRWQADAVEIEIGYGPRRLTLRVRDDGHGLPAGVVAADGHFGLQGMRTSGPRGRAARAVVVAAGPGTEVAYRFRPVAHTCRCGGSFVLAALAGAGFRCRKAVMETETMASTIE